jgi:hypothetical protein
MIAPSRAGRPWALVEIGPETDEVERRALIQAAYRSSRSGVVALAVHGVSMQSVDRILDGLVDARDREVKGVVYLNGNDELTLYAAAANASVVVASSERFRTGLAERGIPAVDLKGSAQLLGA